MIKKHENYQAEFIDSSIEAQIMNIIEVVINTHYATISQQNREDVEQEAFLKMYEKLKSGEFDTARNLRNFLYTVCRNTVHNYLYHINKQPNIEVSDLNSYEIEDNLPSMVTPEQIKDMCDKYRLFGNFFTPMIKNLRAYGLDIKVPEDNEEEEYDPLIFNMVRGRVLWMIAKSVD